VQPARHPENSTNLELQARSKPSDGSNSLQQQGTELLEYVTWLRIFVIHDAFLDQSRPLGAIVLVEAYYSGLWCLLLV
jgi:hypothetical protein